MALDMWGIGVHPSPTAAARLWARSTVTGALTLIINGQTFTGDTLNPSVDDGTGTVSATGLLPNTSYTFTLSCAGDSVSGVLKTMPGNDSDTFDFCVTSCSALNGKGKSANGAMVAQNPAFIANLGDMMYINAGAASYVSAWGEAPVNYNGSVSQGKNADTYRVIWRQSLKHSDAKMCHQAVPTLYMPDDHEYGGDNWDHSLANAWYVGCSAVSMNSPVAGVDCTPNADRDYPSTSTQADCDDYWLAANTAAANYLKGNPPHGDGQSPNKPSLAQAGTPASNYPVRYTRFTAGSAEFFLLDSLSYRSPVRATDNASKTMLGATQKQWLKDRLAACAKTFAIILCPKKTYANNGDNTDSWFAGGTNTGYQTELNEILDYISAKSGFVNPNLTVVWFTGDSHLAAAIYDDTKGHVCLNGSPAGAPTGNTPSAVTGKNRYLGGLHTQACKQYFNIAHGRIVGTQRIELWLRDAAGARMWSGYVNAGENILRYPAVQAAI